MAVRCAIVPPTPVPYREPLFRSLHERDELDICVIYQSAGQPSWDVPPEWFPREHPYPAVHLRSWQRRRAGRTPLLWPRGLERALTTADPDCVVVSEYGPASLRALNWCRRHKRAYVIFTECTPGIDSMLPPWQLGLHRRLGRHADGLIAASSAARARLLAFGIPDDRIAVALQAADVEPVRAAAARARRDRATASMPGTPVRVISTGRLVPDKNFGMLIKAFARAALTPADAQLEIAGAGFLEPDLKELAKRAGVPVHWHGHLPPESLPELYANADIYALISTYEPFGVAVREAAAAAMPIICSRTAGAAGDVAVDGRNAVLVNPYSVEDVAGALDRLVSDAELRRRMGDESRAIDLETDGSEVDAFVEAVVRAAGRRGRVRPPGDPHSNGKAPADYRPSRAGSTSS
ncbi:MAG TPA: glycosyltransferase family 1 protein [Gemmatimonadales bacterium]|nr:glycosyltransferase family 1 protein [Gemmatimonadales bacterium]